MSLEFLPRVILYEVFKQLGSEDLWCLFGTSKAFRHCVAPMLLRKARIGFTWIGFTGIDPDRVSLNGRALHPRVAHDILATWASSVQILKYDFDVTFQTIDLLPRLVNMKYFSIGNTLDNESLYQILQKVADLPALHGLKVWCGQPVVWKHDWNFQNLRYLTIKGLGCERGTLNLPSFPALLDLRMSFGKDNELPHEKKFCIFVDLSRLPCLSALEIEGVTDEDIGHRLTFRGVTKSLRRFTAKFMNGWTFWDAWKCMNESLEEIRLQNSRESCRPSTELNFPRLKALEVENSMDCLPLLNIGLPVLTHIDLKLGPGDFGYLQRHLSLSISVLQKLPITLNLMHDEIHFDDHWPEELDSQDLETLVRLISLPNVRLGEDRNMILDMLLSWIKSRAALDLLDIHRKPSK